MQLIWEKCMLTDDKNTVVKLFLQNLGEKIRYKREIKCIKQDNLARYLDINKSNISRYEAGLVDFPVSNLALISRYCDFPLRDYFDEYMDYSMALTIKDMAMLVKRKYTDKDKRKAVKERAALEMEFLVGQIYEKDGKRYVKEAPQTVSTPTKEISKYEQCMRGNAFTNSNVIPFTDQEFNEYINNNKQLLSVYEAGKSLYECVAKDKRNKKLRNNIADYMIGEIIVEPFMKETSWDALRAYAYYKNLMGK